MEIEVAFEHRRKVMGPESPQYFDSGALNANAIARFVCNMRVVFCDVLL